MGVLLLLSVLADVLVLLKLRVKVDQLLASVDNELGRRAELLLVSSDQDLQDGLALSHDLRASSRSHLRRQHEEAGTALDGDGVAVSKDVLTNGGGIVVGLGCLTVVAHRHVVGGGVDVRLHDGGVVLCEDLGANATDQCMEVNLL